MNCTSTSAAAAMASKEDPRCPDFTAKLRTSWRAGGQELKGHRDPAGWDTTRLSSPRLLWPENNYIQLIFYSLNTLIVFAIAGALLLKIFFHHQQIHGLLMVPLSCVRVPTSYNQ